MGAADDGGAAIAEVVRRPGVLGADDHGVIHVRLASGEDDALVEGLTFIAAGGETEELLGVELKAAGHAVGVLRPVGAEAAEDRDDGASVTGAPQVEVRGAPHFEAAVLLKLIGFGKGEGELAEARLAGGQRRATRHPEHDRAAFGIETAFDGRARGFEGDRGVRGDGVDHADGEFPLAPDRDVRVQHRAIGFGARDGDAAGVVGAKPAEKKPQGRGRGIGRVGAFRHRCDGASLILRWLPLRRHPLAHRRTQGGFAAG